MKIFELNGYFTAIHVMESSNEQTENQSTCVQNSNKNGDISKSDTIIVK